MVLAAMDAAGATEPVLEIAADAAEVRAVSGASPTRDQQLAMAQNIGVRSGPGACARTYGPTWGSATMRP